MQPINTDFLAQWEKIVNDVEMDRVPLTVVKKIIFKHNGNRQKTINIKVLKKQNLNTDEISNIVERYLTDHDDTLCSVEFVVDIEAVAQILQPETDKLLKDI